MMRARTRLGWAVPILVLAAMAVLLSTLVGTAGGSTTTLPTSPVTVPDGPALEGSGSGASADGTSATSAAVFTVRAQDLGDFTGSAPSVSSRSAIVVNMTTGKVLYSRKANTKRPMASTTKIMTAVLVLESLPLDKQITISQTAAQTSEPKPFLHEGDVLTVEQLLYCLMVHSSNSAAVAMAEAADGGVEGFVESMNGKAAELGMESTNFTNPNGLDAPGHYSTAADMSILARYAMKNAEFRKLVGSREYALTIPGRTEALVFESTNKLMVRADWVTGVKTGLTPNADQCLVASGTKNGVSIVSVVLGQPSTKVCWDESEALLNYGLSQYKHLTLLEAGVGVAEAEVPYHLDGTIKLVTERKLEIDLYKDDNVTAKVRLERQLQLPVQAGEAFGEVVLTNGDKTVGSVDLVADKSFDETTLGTKVRFLFNRLGAWLGGDE